MKIAIDIDNTICNTSLFFGKLAEDYDRNILHKNSVINYSKVVPRSSEWSEEELKYYVENIFNKRTLEIPIKEDAKEYINRLKEEGNYILFITNRGCKEDDHTDLVTEEYLNMNNILYDEVITRSNDKYKYLDGVDIFIDDAKFNCEQALENSKSKIILYETDKTRDYQNDLIYKASNWADIYNYINTTFNPSTCLSMQYKLLKGMYFDDMDDNKDYTLCTSKVMDDSFWNLLYLKTKLDDNLMSNIVDKFKKINRNPAFYIGRGDNYYLDNKNYLLDHNYKLGDTDVVMVLDNYKDTNISIDIKIVEKEAEYNDFMTVLSSAYNDSVESEEENVYAGAVTKSYYDAIKNTIDSDKTYHIIAYDNNVPVSVATINILDGIAEINNVGTRQGYWNKGYSKQVLTYLVKLFKEKDGNKLFLCTEYHSKNQEYYESLGFKEAYVMEQYIK